MTEAVAGPEPASTWGRRLRRLGKIVLIVIVLEAIATAAGWDIRAWFDKLWDTLTSISIGYIIAGVALTTVKTVTTAIAWYWILRTAYGEEAVGRREVIACYATAVALNGFLPANLGTLVMLFMYTAVVAGATFSGVLGGYVVHKIFYMVSGAAVYLYLFLSVAGSFDIKFDWIHEHKLGTVVIVVGGAILCVMVFRLLRAKFEKIWEEAKVGGQILGQRRRYLGRVVLPQFIGWCAGLGVIAVFLAAYGIPVTFNTIMNVTGGNSIANTISFTPGGVGVNQAFNVATLNGVTDATTATAYSVGQQLITTAWNQVFAIVMVVLAFGWTGGKELVTDSYADAKRKAEEQRQAAAERKAAKRRAEAEAKTS
jgi:uncharacterized membrane protein YbhN (UPF0104 family)